MGYLVIAFGGLIGYFLVIGGMPFLGVLASIIATMIGANELTKAKARKFRRRSRY